MSGSGGDVSNGGGDWTPHTGPRPDAGGAGGGTGGADPAAAAGDAGDAELVAQLNDLLRLDHDAIAGYDAAIAALRHEEWRQRIRDFRGDHERHVAELTPLVRAHGGTPATGPQQPSELARLLTQKMGAAGGDVGVLLAFKANERQVRDRYRDLAARIQDPAAATVVQRGADDEARHYRWALETLDDLGAGVGSAAGRAESIFEAAHKAVGDALEGLERATGGAIDNLRRNAREKPLETALVGLALGAVAAGLGRRR